MRRPSRERTLLELLVNALEVTVPILLGRKCVANQSRKVLQVGCGHTERSCRGWRKRRSTEASSTSWGRRTRRRRRHRRYHLQQYISTPISFFLLYIKFGVRRTDSGRLDHVADRESLDGLVLGSASRAVGATDGLDVAAALLVASARRKKNPSLVFGVVQSGWW